jgi:arsenite-transporting ATPase
MSYLRDDSHTDVIIVTLPEASPVFEAERLKADLERAGIKNKWWTVNKSFFGIETKNKTLLPNPENERTWINTVKKISNNNCALIMFKI